MPDGTKPDGKAVKSTFLRLVQDYWQGSALSKKLPPAAYLPSIQTAMQDVDVEKLFNEEPIPEEVVKRRDALIVAFSETQGYPSTARRNIAQGQAVIDMIATLSKSEFVTSTDAGNSAIGQSVELKKVLDDYNKSLAEAEKLALSLPLVRANAEFETYEGFLAIALQKTNAFGALMTDISAACERLVETSAIKAYLVGNPTPEMKDFALIEWGVNQAISGISAANGLASKIPEPHTQVVTMALTHVLTGVKVAKAYVAKSLRERTLERAVRQHQKTAIKGAEQDALDTDPTLMAKWLKTQREESLELVLVLADAAMNTVGSVVPFVSMAWTGVRSEIATAFERYQGERIRRLQESISGKPADPTAVQAVKKVAKDVATETWTSFKDTLFGVVNYLNFIEGVAEKQIGTWVADFILQRITVNPAEGVDGGQLRALVNGFEEAFLASVPQLRNAGNAGPVEARSNASRPDTAADGRQVQSYLGGVIKDAEGKEYRIVKIDDVQGALYLETREFKVGDDAPKVNTGLQQLIDLVPAVDHKGRPVAEIDLSVGYVFKDSLGIAGVDLTGKGVRVRVGRMWGYIDQQTRNFFPVDIEPGGYADWSKRKLTQTGYEEAGTAVAGTWHQPWPDRKNEFAFIGEKGTEWALGIQSTARGKGHTNNVATALANVPMTAIKLTDL